MATSIEEAIKGTQDTPKDVFERAKIQISDAIAVRMYELEKLAAKNYTEARAGAVALQMRTQEAVTKANEKAKMYRLELKRVNAAHRTKILEYKELKRKYDDLLQNDFAQLTEKAYQEGYKDGRNEGYQTGYDEAMYDRE